MVPISLSYYPPTPYHAPWWSMVPISLSYYPPTPYNTPLV
jgi:hypothetical protein